MKNMSKMLKQAQKMQQQVMKAQEELQRKEYEGVAGGGMVKVVVNGKNELVSIKINKEVVDPEDVEMLEDLIVAAHTSAMEQVKGDSESVFGSLQSGLGLPGM
ncbi:MAG: YbaB/EbfC family nucleoid-associated protein [Chitinispirillia bacterium]|nr:YbaB/EbfC family nucleoid-associated protein [Chitinispirillia bacterium]MCL2269502.1 YbaB/EbfC family nucleoid-associated protein [Chitinispirillia bacterium]